IREEARAAGYDDVDDLARLHEHVDACDALALAKRLTYGSRAARPTRLLHDVLRAALPEVPWDVVDVQAAAHVRILVAGDRTAPAPAHTDFAIGHGSHERNVWIALTDAR